ncbi:hypothetical protein CLAFUW4_02352 [Fulvia fulva]|uniref:Uncharacterized protein n=1 Tax=Passalora fulva TaxID=5499 RepID=A0A9Q8LAN9_PASFU|nr:uncharacterized protein CLAFUR5_02341 [Fulvia fulva]KAK4631073.1 hypothetical protein CLAFUR4_02347 [Fulvia fulva]KAK4633487.1 hypothetical protein CLAFUR0_02351 [Fulvia fulva]UJO13870.1 hypothetical protein CLAFUR5_02341 [Fulvia fulva]WPV11028.1 hypothetical protein CLAFUW4_02352 [Fulvia fulva]WPV26435.1 hypothetical protein CLAFUW7_02352 [Fulvia fulva]
MTVERDSGAAAREVANTYELVEQILLGLRDWSQQYVNEAEMVSKTFQHVLKRSSSLRTRLEIPSEDDLRTRATGKDDFGDRYIRRRFAPLPEIFTELEITRSDPSSHFPELAIFASVPHFRMTDNKWRRPGSWRSWLFLRGSTKYIQSVHASGNGRWKPHGESKGGWWDMDFSYRSATGITLGDLVDIAYELKDFSEGLVTVDFDVAVDEQGVGKRHATFADDFVDSDEEDAVDGQVPVEFPDYHEVMQAAHMLKASAGPR